MLILDVSSNQGQIDWLRVRQDAQHVDGVFIKLNEGVQCPDARARENAVMADKQNFPLGIGYYHFATLNNMRAADDARAEAQETLGIVRTLPTPKLGILLDIEEEKIDLSPAQVEEWANSFMEVFERAGYTNLKIYGGKPFFDRNLSPNHRLGRYPLIVPAYPQVYDPHMKPNLPRGWNDYWAHQYTCTGRVDGIKTRVDLSRK